MSQKSILSFFSKKEPIIINNVSPKCNNTITEINNATIQIRSVDIEKIISPVTVKESDAIKDSVQRNNEFASNSSKHQITPIKMTSIKKKSSKRLRIESSSSSSSSSGSDGDNDNDNDGDNVNDSKNKKISPPPKKKDRLTITKDKSPKANGKTPNNKMDTDQLVEVKSNKVMEQKTENETPMLKTPPPPPLSDKPQTPSNIFLTSHHKKPEMKVQSVGEGHKGADYDPSKQNYDPIKDAFWQYGEKVPYLALTRTFALIEEISSRLRMIEVFSNFLRSVIVLSPKDFVSCVYLSLNQLAPAYEGLELGIAETTLMKVIAQTTGRTLAQVKHDAQVTGDLGIVAERSKTNQRLMFVPAPLMVATVFTKLKEIAKMSGSASMVKKSDKIQSIFVSCRHSESRFFIRSLLGKLRIGLAEQSLLQAISLACTLTPPNQNDGDFPPKILNSSRGQQRESKFKALLDSNTLQVKSAYCQCPNYDRIIAVLQEYGIAGLAEHCVMVPGTPLKPMLAHPTKGVSEVLQRFDGLRFTCEYKYDGERAQIHISDTGTVNIYSRNQENNTSKYPDIITRIADCKLDTVRSCILDCEAVAWDVERQQILPFQVLTTRKRKDATESEIKVQVCVFMFDLLYLNGTPLITLPFMERRKLLHAHFRECTGIWKFAMRLDTNDIDELQQFLEESVHGNCEGLMIKTLDHEATYEIAKRSRNWLKLKKDYMSGVGDSLDLVVIGGYRGRGKRSGHYGGYLLACYDQENEEYQSICKIGTGFSDENLQTHSEYFKRNVIQKAKSYYRYDSSHEPDEWFEPMQVWEVKCADLSLSPVHKAGMGIIDPEKGISLRFPRFIRIREDKKCEDATSAQQVADMYSDQDQIKNQINSKNVEDDFY